MLRPSYTELMEVLNNQADIDMKITSRYTIVIAAAKRARQLIDGEQCLAFAESDKAVSCAITEMAEGKLNITMSRDFDENAWRADNAALNVEFLNQEDLGYM